MITRTELISPERAAADLKAAAGKNYRRLSKKWVASLAEDFQKRFDFNHKPIEYDENGILHDGQHRLSAVVASGLTLPFVVVYGSKPSVTEGCIRRRTMPDHLYANGATNTIDLSAALGLVSAYMNGGIADRPRLSHAELSETWELCPRLSEYVNLAKQKHSARITSPAQLGAVMYISSVMLEKPKDFSLAEEFIRKLSNGAGMERTDPVLILRERLIDEKRGTKRLDRKVKLAYIVKAWNAFVAGDEMKVLRWSMEQAFPEIK